jgi:hypothetical protein
MSVHLVLDDEDLNKMIPINATAGISENYVDGINPMSFTPAMDSLLPDKCDTAIKEE